MFGSCWSGGECRGIGGIVVFVASKKIEELERPSFTMETNTQINTYIESLSEETAADLRALHALMLQWIPNGKLWFDNGLNGDNKVVTNPTIGYGSYPHTFANKTNKELFQIGISATKSGISVYVMGIRNKLNLAQTFGEKLGKAKVSGYCISFKKCEDLNLGVLEEVVRQGLGITCSNR